MTDQPGNPTTPTSPTTSPADGTPEALAAKLISLLDQFESLVPGFQPHDIAEIRRVAIAARYGSELIPPMITAVSSFAPAERNVFDVGRGKATLQSEDALRPVAHRLSALLDGFVFTLDSNLAQTGTEALHAYAWAKHFAKSPEGIGLRPFLALMQRAVRKTLNLRKAPAPKPAPPTTPTPTKPPAQGFLAPNLASRPTAPTTPDDDLPEDFRRALEAVSDDED
jgi:hypothetical protein